MERRHRHVQTPKLFKSLLRPLSRRSLQKAMHLGGSAASLSLGNGVGGVLGGAGGGAGGGGAGADGADPAMKARLNKASFREILRAHCNQPDLKVSGRGGGVKA